MAKAKPRIPLSPELIYQMALEQINQAGLEKFSMRSLATRLGVDPMAVYHHIPSKAALMEGIYDTIFGELLAEDQPMPDHWQDKLLELAHRFRALALRHHKLFPSLIASNHIGHNELKALDTLLGTLLEAGLDPTATVQVGDSVFALVTGFVILEISELQNTTPHTGTERLESENQTDFINTRTLLEPLTDNLFRNSFETGLQLIIDGIKVKLQKN